MSSKQMKAQKIINQHVIWAMGAGLVPIPLFDIAAITAVQLDMLNQLAELYEIDFSRSAGKTFLGALTGSTFSVIGASLVKAIPGIGSVIGGVSLSIAAGASTYGVGQVAAQALETEGTFLNMDMDEAKRSYKKAYQKGKKVASEMDDETQEEAEDVFQSLEKLGKMRDRGIITEEEFEAQKKKLLERL